MKSQYRVRVHGVRRIFNRPVSTILSCYLSILRWALLGFCSLTYSTICLVWDWNTGHSLGEGGRGEDNHFTCYFFVQLRTDSVPILSLIISFLIHSPLVTKKALLRHLISLVIIFLLWLKLSVHVWHWLHKVAMKICCIKLFFVLFGNFFYAAVEELVVLSYGLPYYIWHQFIYISILAPSVYIAPEYLNPAAYFITLSIVIFRFCLSLTFTMTSVFSMLILILFATTRKWRCKNLLKYKNTNRLCWHGWHTAWMVR